LCNAEIEYNTFKLPKKKEIEKRRDQTGCKKPWDGPPPKSPRKNFEGRVVPTEKGRSDHSPKSAELRIRKNRMNAALWEEKGGKERECMRGNELSDNPVTEGDGFTQLELWENTDFEEGGPTLADYPMQVGGTNHGGGGTNFKRGEGEGYTQLAKGALGKFPIKGQWGTWSLIASVGSTEPARNSQDPKKGGTASGTKKGGRSEGKQLRKDALASRQTFTTLGLAARNTIADKNSEGRREKRCTS